MCPKRYQRGFLMPLAIFIIVIMAGFAMVMARTTAQSNTSVVQTAVSVQAFYAADSGAQWGLNRLFYQAAPLSRANVDAACTGLNGVTVTFAAPGLSGCDSQLQCASTNDPANTTSYYQITSSATCGTEPVMAERAVQVSSFMR